jgi:hypothetical protein
MSSSSIKDIRAEYSSELIRSGERGKYVERYRQGMNVVLIDADLHEHYPDSEAVNRALREHLADHPEAAT